MIFGVNQSLAEHEDFSLSKYSRYRYTATRTAFCTYKPLVTYGCGPALPTQSPVDHQSILPWLLEAVVTVCRMGVDYSIWYIIIILYIYIHIHDCTCIQATLRNLTSPNHLLYDVEIIYRAQAQLFTILNQSQLCVSMCFFPWWPMLFLADKVQKLCLFPPTIPGMILQVTQTLDIFRLVLLKNLSTPKPQPVGTSASEPFPSSSPTLTLLPEYIEYKSLHL